MAFHLILALAGATLIGSAGSGTTTPPTDRMSDAEAFSAAAGQVLGAATMCDSISKDRIQSAADRVGEVTQGLAANDDELNAAKAVFKSSLQEGGHAVASGDTDCGHVDAALGEMEQAIKP
jgi:hypothetical protein